jgi:CarD family transcriptional regulator
MFSIGDRIVYPMHGAGIIEAIEEKQIFGEARRYYILRIPIGDMKIMIPCESTDCVGVREIIDKKQLKGVEVALRGDSTEMSCNWNRRYRDNMDKLKTGEMKCVCEVVGNLMRADRIKKLSAGEKKMLSSAKRILISELILVSSREPDDLLLFIEQLVYGEN